MGILKNKSWFVIFILLSITSVQAQNQETLDAFTQSYTNEYNGDYTKAIQNLKKIYSEDSYPINLRLGWLSYSGGDFTNSIAFYTKAINIMPYSIEARLGIVYPASAVGNWTLVETTYKKILEIDPKNYTANYRLASINYGRQSYKSANYFLEMIVNLYPFNYETTILYAWNNLQLGKTKEARLLFNKALLLSPNDTSAMQGLELLNK